MQLSELSIDNLIEVMTLTKSETTCQKCWDSITDFSKLSTKKLIALSKRPFFTNLCWNKIKNRDDLKPFYISEFMQLHYDEEIAIEAWKQLKIHPDLSTQILSRIIRVFAMPSKIFTQIIDEAWEILIKRSPLPIQFFYDIATDDEVTDKIRNEAEIKIFEYSDIIEGILIKIILYGTTLENRYKAWELFKVRKKILYINLKRVITDTKDAGIRFESAEMIKSDYFASMSCLIGD
jgi:hypothetical protein